ncbi:TorF family putative porin [Qipengyuania zhejiangensis]|uniref:TorF family putative porin n=1 Tax=Qipengyuania zhejiangensis TaxID=3077782 RepID=UPI002D76528A|nr:TorF family putative porin [Qipengyuania sp. Z2]
MRTSFRGLMAASLATASLLSATPVLAQDEGEDDGIDGVTISANVALTTDYRFRGVSLSGGDPALQGGFDVAHESGFYVGTWASSIKGGPAYGDMELDLYAGWGGNITDAVSVDVGILYYLYPSEDLGLDTDYWEPYASLGFNLGPAEATVGVAYAFEQDSLGGDDNLYVYTDLGFGLPNTPITLNGHLGYTDGALAPPLLAGTGDDTGIDWSIGASVAKGNFEVGVSYVGVDGPSIDGFTDDAIVGTITASF